MPDLSKSLQDHDLGHLQIVAELWGIPLTAPDTRQALPMLVAGLLEPDLVQETMEILPEDARLGLEALVREGGRLPWALFNRRYGPLREMGTARRDRELPHRSPASVAEVLWYRALVARAFFDSPSGPQEFAYIPQDFLMLLQFLESPETQEAGEGPDRDLDHTPARSPGHPASAQEQRYPRLTTDHLLDHACTQLAALRLGEPEAPGLPDDPQLRAALPGLLAAAGLLDESSQPEPEATRSFLEMERGAALARLAQAWRESEAFNELLLVPHLQAEGEWSNDPRQARQTVLEFMDAVPQGQWWSLAAFMAAIRQGRPDFQRPAGDYDSWFLRDRRTGDWLRGFEHWEAVDGALVRYLVGGPMHWLGLLDLASSQAGGAVEAFRRTPWAEALLSGSPVPGLPAEDQTLTVRSDGRLVAPRLVPRSARYQLARFCIWEGVQQGFFHYRLTPASLGRARQQGLRVNHLMSLLQRQAQSIPPNIPRALDRWETQGVEARLEQATVLRLRSAEVLESLRRSRAARFLGDPLGPAAVMVKPGAEERVMAILAEMGYLGEIK